MIVEYKYELNKRYIVLYEGKTQEFIPSNIIIDIKWEEVSIKYWGYITTDKKHNYISFNEKDIFNSREELINSL